MPDPSGEAATKVPGTKIYKGAWHQDWAGTRLPPCRWGFYVERILSLIELLAFTPFKRSLKVPGTNLSGAWR
jgi:hypothetical protein